MGSGRAARTGGGSSPWTITPLALHPPHSQGRAELRTLLQDSQSQQAGTALAPRRLCMGDREQAGFTRSTDVAKGKAASWAEHREGPPGPGWRESSAFQVSHDPGYGPCRRLPPAFSDPRLERRRPVGTALDLLLFLKDKRKTDAGRPSILIIVSGGKLFATASSGMAGGGGSVAPPAPLACLRALGFWLSQEPQC